MTTKKVLRWFRLSNPLNYTICGFALFALIWEGIRAVGIVHPSDLPSLVSIGFAFIEYLRAGQLARLTYYTLRAALLGLAISSVIGITVGVIFALRPRIEYILRPIVEFLRPMPSVALIPIALLLLGANFWTEIILITYASIWPILFNTMAGVQSIDALKLDVAKLLFLSKWQRFRLVYLYSSLSFIGTGIRTSAAIAFILAVTMEMLIGQPGLGREVLQSRLAGDYAAMWATIMLLGILGVLLNLFFMESEARLMPWKRAENHGH